MGGKDMDIGFFKVRDDCDFGISFEVEAGCCFADFDEHGARVFLKRISFDGSGCFQVCGTANPLNTAHSEDFLDAADTGDFDSNELFEIVKTAVQINRPLLENADNVLKKFNLIGENHFILCRDKFDTQSIEKITAEEIKANPELYAGLLECLQDMNWPVAQTALNKIPRDDKAIIPYLNAALTSGDEDWTAFIKDSLLNDLHEEILAEVCPDFLKNRENKKKNANINVQLALFPGIAIVGIIFCMLTKNVKPLPFVLGAGAFGRAVFAFCGRIYSRGRWFSRRECIFEGLFFIAMGIFITLSLLRHSLKSR